MKLNLSLIFIFFISFSTFAQSELETYPVFDQCKNSTRQKECFQNELISKLKKNYQHPKSAENQEFTSRVLFEVDSLGQFKIIYINAKNLEVKSELEKSFENLPKVEPATYNRKARSIRFTIPISTPIQSESNTQVHETKILEENKKIRFKKNTTSSKTNNLTTINSAAI